MTLNRLLRDTFMIGLGLLPAGMVLAQEGDQPDRPNAERRQDREPRRTQRGRPDPEQMRRQMQRRLEENLRRQFGEMPGRPSGSMRPYLIAPEGIQPLPVPFDEIFNQLVAEDHGLGLTLRPVPEVLRSHLDLPEGRGMVVAEVAEESPAAGTIEPNDILLRLGGTDVGEDADLRAALEEAEGDTIAITLLRRGEETTVEVERPRPEEPEATTTERYLLGVTIETPDDAVRAQLGLPEGQGVIVMEVAPDSAAEEAGVKANDILVKLGGEPIVGARELAEQVQENGGEAVELTLLRDGEETTVEVTPEKRPAPPIPNDAPRPPGGMRFFGPGVMIDPETGNVLRPGPGGQPGMVPFRDLLPSPASPEMERQLDEILEQLKQLREEVDALKQSRSERDDRDGA